MGIWRWHLVLSEENGSWVELFVHCHHARVVFPHPPPTFPGLRIRKRLTYKRRYDYTMKRNIPCSLENDMPSSKSSSQLSVCSSGWLRTAGKGSARGAAFFAAAGGATFLAADEAGSALRDEARATGEEDSLKRALIGETGCSCRATSRWSRPPCFEGRDGAG